MNPLDMPSDLHHEAPSTCSKTMHGDIFGLRLGREVDGEQNSLGTYQLEAALYKPSEHR